MSIQSVTSPRHLKPTKECIGAFKVRNRTENVLGLCSYSFEYPQMFISNYNVGLMYCAR